MSKPLSVHRPNWVPFLALAPSLSHTVTITASSFPFQCVRRYHTSKTPEFVIQKTYFQFPNQKQTAMKRASSSSSQASGFMHPRPHDAWFTPGHFVPTEGRGYKTAASHVKDLATLQTQ